MRQFVLVIGQGEIGKPLSRLLGSVHEMIGIDVDPVEVDHACDVVHICYPFEIEDFVGVTTRYLKKYTPSLAIINSTVAPGTTRRIFESSGVAVAHSPVRGKHVRMDEELLRYVKFVGGITPEAGARAAEHFQSIGMRTRVLSSPEATELAKLSETTYFGLLIAWAQEVDRYCRQLNASYDEVIEFFTEIGYLPPVKYFPGVIGGHCVMPNIEILRSMISSDMLDAIYESNEETKKLASDGARKVRSQR